MDEYICREDVLKAFKLIAKNPNKDYQRGMQDTIDCLVPKVIADIPAADVQPIKHGRWIWDSNAPHREHGAYKCSNCGCHSDFEENYCYNCGTRMDGGAKLQRLERCKKCSKSTEEDDFQGGTELYCPLHGYPCDMIIQCVYISDNKRYE